MHTYLRRAAPDEHESPSTGERPLHGGRTRTWGASAASALKMVTGIAGLMLSQSGIGGWIWTPLSELYLVVLSNFRKDEK